MRLPEPYYSRVLRFCKELASGRWHQIDGKLRVDGPVYDKLTHLIANVRFCCLGVACELALREGVGHRVDAKYWDTADAVALDPAGNTSDLTGAVMAFYGFDDANPELTILCSQVSDSQPGNWCEDCRGVPDDERNVECTNTINVSATDANDDLGLAFTQIADGFARRWLGGVEALHATPTS